MESILLTEQQQQQWKQQQVEDILKRKLGNLQVKNVNGEQSMPEKDDVKLQQDKDKIDIIFQKGDSKRREGNCLTKDEQHSKL